MSLDDEKIDEPAYRPRANRELNRARVAVPLRAYGQ
jgi:hypothetical protein